MATGAKGLGRGLDALFKNTPEAGAKAQTLPIDSLQPNPQQPRRHFVEQHIQELAASIKSQGVLQPILVRPAKDSDGKYEILAGERRWRASKAAGLAEVPVVIKDLTDQEALVVALMENLQREDLTPLEEAQGMHRLKEEFGLSQEDLATRLGKSRSAIANTLRLLSLPEAAQDDLTHGRLTAGHARALLTITDAKNQEAFRAYIVKFHLSVREAEQIAAGWKETGCLPPNIAGEEAPAETSPAAQGATPARARKTSERLVKLEEHLAQTLTLPVSITGKESRGKVSFSFRSKEELGMLLKHLGISGEKVL